MPTFCANLTLLFTEVPFLERFQAARDAGFTWVEALFPYDDPASDIRKELDRNGLKMALFNSPPPNFTGGEKGWAAMPEQKTRFEHDIKRVLRYAEVLKPKHLHIMAGNAEGPEARATFIANLKLATGAAPDQSFTIEPLNPDDFPGYFLNDFDQAIDIIDAVGAPNLALQYDVWHAHKITGDALKVWDDFGSRSTHIQIGRLPDRKDPIGGDFDFPAFFKRLDAEGYDGIVSGEYFPEGRTEDGLGWLTGS